MKHSIFTDTMADMNWMEIEKMGKKKVPVLFPIGVIEEHGPHLPLGTDIYWSYEVCRMIRQELENRRIDALVAPPYYWGINHCTSAFPGTFSVKQETMKLVLCDIFENLHQFGFDTVYCFNFHGDRLQVTTILDAIKTANEKFGMKIQSYMGGYELGQYGLTGEEDYIFVDRARYPLELFKPEKDNLLDIHAGALETAAMKYLYPDSVNEELAKGSKSYSLTMDGLRKWCVGGETTRSQVPLGYAGNPAGYESKYPRMEQFFKIMTEYCADKIIDEIEKK